MNTQNLTTPVTQIWPPPGLNKLNCFNLGETSVWEMSLWIQGAAFSFSKLLSIKSLLINDRYLDT